SYPPIARRSSALLVLEGVIKRRNTTVYKEVSLSLNCEESDGPGYVSCAGGPKCYNPSKGEVCCSDGS
ncbi:hypothetical protein QL093DRAFT_2546950, partial [Fusarium oxysporum]